jgi:hypothetical protein
MIDNAKPRPMKLIIAKPSPYARKARVALIEKGIGFETVVDNPWQPETMIPGSSWNTWRRWAGRRR